MMENIGFMQGRLSNLVDNKIQFFPWDNWKNEFMIASKIKFNLMEWTLDYDRLYENPLMQKAGINNILELSKKYNVKIKSITGDCFMQMPFWKNSHKEKVLKKQFEDIILACSEVGIKIIVVPLVDNGSVTSKKEENKIYDFCLQILPLLKEKKLKIAFETDFNPKAVENFVKKLDHEYFGINYDIGNSAGLGFDSNEEILRYGEKIINVHIKDRKLNGNTVILGQGNANFKKVFKNLNKINYRGNYILQAARSPENNHVGILNDYRSDILRWMKGH